MPSDSEALTSLAFASKQFWGYSVEQIDAWESDLRISPRSIEAEPTFVIEMRGRLLAVLQLKTVADPWEVECLWVHPDAVHQGLGTRLMHEAIAHARLRGQAQLAIDADPNAEGFYLRIGARRLGAKSAPIPGNPQRIRPQLMLLTLAPD